MPADAQIKPPLWLLAEVSYACPLQCVYCSNPLELGRRADELDTESWLRVLRQARALGAAQLGFSGGEPLVRRDLERLIAEARQLGFYTNLITSAVGMDQARLERLVAAGLDHIQISFQAADRRTSRLIAGTDYFEHKRAMARAVKAAGLPMVLNFVLHRHNIDQLQDMLELSESVGADYVELANTQYYGWGLANRAHLLPSRGQLERARAVTEAFRARVGERMRLYFVVPDYYENRPKPCMAGWGRVFLLVAPDGTALPCHGARQIRSLSFPNVRNASVAEIWYHAPAFNAFRGEDWMPQPCRGCPEREQDFGGCRCQAYQLLGDAALTDPVCDRSPHHQLVLDAVAAAQHSEPPPAPLVYRNPRNARRAAGVTATTATRADG
ncbi:MAG: pyrroloquinoline quinone biosynthesis protein PqqE [Gammaproteobacteria bacterium]|nr:pyrroloquinoline quinone biosynthesis protein PqqE [Gammaproteobacteria bacterium]